MDTVITGSMISNYVKKKLAPNPVKKMYYRDHITQLIVIAIMKSVVSLDQVKMILQMEEEGITEETYNRFSKEFDYALKKSFNLESEIVDSKHENNMETILGDIVSLVAHKVYIDKLLASLE
jgi:DNA-binding transcriptional MerR regulator